MTLHDMHMHMQAQARGHVAGYGSPGTADNRAGAVGRAQLSPVLAPLLAPARSDLGKPDEFSAPVLAAAGARPQDYNHFDRSRNSTGSSQVHTLQLLLRSTF